MYNLGEMIVKDLDIKEFRGIKSCKRPIEFSKFTVLIGRNNSGKTTVLEALSLLPNPQTAEYITEKTKIDFIRDIHDQWNLTSNKQRNYRTLLHQYAGTSTIDYNRMYGKYYRTLKSLYGETSMFSKDIKISINKKKFECNFGAMKIEGLNQIITPQIPDYIKNFLKIVIEKSGTSVIYIPFNTEYIKHMEKRMYNLQDLIIKNKIHVKVAKILNKCVDDEYSEILFKEQMELRKITQDNFTYIRINDLGSGAEKLVKIMALIEVIHPKLILIDDFEVGYHPTMIDVFLKWLLELDSQVVITTHSIDILYKLTDIEPTNTKVLFLKKSHEDILDYNIFTLHEIEDFLNANTDPRKFNF